MDIQTLLDNLTEEVSCKICAEIYKEPKQLPCLHSFCLACLNRLASTRAVNGNIQCPLCQREVAVPESGTFETLPSSFYINSLLDVLAIKQCGATQVTCGNCATKSGDTSYCFNCSDFWCGGCLGVHNKLRANKEHRVVSLKVFQAKDYEDVFKRPTICNKMHHGEVLKYYCKECEMAACQVCLSLEHGGHSMQHLEVVAGEEKAKMLAQVEKVKAEMQRNYEQILTINRDRIDVQEHVEAVKREVSSFANEMIRVIREQERKLIREADAMRKTLQDRLTDDKEKIQENVKRIESVVNQAENLVQRGNSAEIVRSRKEVEEHLQQITKAETLTRPSTQESKLAFGENPFLVKSLAADGIGHLGTTHTDRVQSTAEGEGLTKAVTGLEAQFVVTTRNSKGDVCYSPVDRVAMEIKRRGDEESVKIIQVQDNRNGTYQVSYFATDPGDHDVRVTVNKEDVRGSPFPSIQVKPREFKPVMSFGEKGAGPEEFDEPWGIAVNEHGEIAVTDHCNHRVQLFGKETEFILSFGEEGSEEGQLNKPRGVVFNKEGNLLVVDRGNNRIQQFTRNGQFIRIFGELESKLDNPCGMSTCPNGNVIVADRNSKRVVVFSPEGRVLLTLHDDKLDPVHCVYHDNRFIVSDENGNCIKVFSANGVFLYKFGRKGVADGEFNKPVGLAVDKAGRLVVCDEMNNRVQLFNLDGTFSCKFGIQGTGLGNINQPGFVVVLRDGKFAITESTNNRVQIIH